MLTHGKTYKITKLGGEVPIHRGGVEVGTWPQVGYGVTVKGVASGLAGTEVAAHAVAELLYGVGIYTRRWILTEEEYNEHRRVLDENHAALMEAFPYTLEEEASLAKIDDRYRSTIENGKESQRRNLMALDRPQYIAWNESAHVRPELPRLEDTEEETAAPRM